MGPSQNTTKERDLRYREHDVSILRNMKLDISSTSLFLCNSFFLKILCRSLRIMLASAIMVSISFSAVLTSSSPSPSAWQTSSSTVSNSILSIRAIISFLRVAIVRSSSPQYVSQDKQCSPSFHYQS